MGNIYVADSRNDRVEKFDINGNFIMEIGSFGYSEGNLNRPVDVVVDSKDQIYVLDSGNHRIEIFGRYGHYRGEIVLSKNGRYNFVTLILDELLAVTDNKNGMVLIYSKSGILVQRVENFDYPEGITSDESGNIYLIESGTSQLTKLPLETKTGNWNFEK